MRDEILETAVQQAEALRREWGEANGDGHWRVRARVVLDGVGVPVIAGANTKVVEVVSHLKAYGGTPEEIHRQLPHLSVEQVEAALAYYQAHQEEIEEDLKRRLAEVERLRQEMRQPPIAERLRKPS